MKIDVKRDLDDTAYGYKPRLNGGRGAGLILLLSYVLSVYKPFSLVLSYTVLSAVASLLGWTPSFGQVLP